MSVTDPGPSVAAATLKVAARQVSNLAAALYGLITPGKQGDTETISNVAAQNGTVTLGKTGAILYSAGASGTDTLSFTVTDQLGDKVSASVTLAIDPGPSVVATPIKVAHGATVSLASLGASLVTPGLAGDTESFSAVSATSGVVTTSAAGAVSYTAPTSGTATLSYRVTDQLGDSVTASSTLLIDPGPAIVAGGSIVRANTKADLTALINADITAGLPGDTETITSITASAGVVSLAANGTITFTAPASGSAVLTYTVVDQLGDTATGKYIVTVNPAALSGNTLLYASATSSVSTGAGNIGIQLINAAGVVIASTTSNSGGWFGIGNIPAGTYQIQYIVPFGDALYPNINTVNTTTLRTPSFTLAAGQGYYVPPLSLIPVGEIIGTVLLAGVGEAGVSVYLLTGSGFFAGTTTTDSTGAFTFANVPPGTYEVRYIAPAGQGLVDGGPASAATGTTGSYALAQGQLVTLAPQSMAVGATPPNYPSLAFVNPSNLTFDDEFNSFVSSPYGQTGWMTQYPFGGVAGRTDDISPNWENEFYSDSSVGVNPFSVSNGILSITASPAPAGYNTDGQPYVSGVITSFRSLSQEWGYFEARVEMPSGQGIWPAFWMLPESNVNNTEMDIFEVIGSAPGKLLFTTHSLVNGTWVVDSQYLNVPNVSAGFHSYGLDMEPTGITLYLDGIPLATAPTPANYAQPMYMILNVSVGGVGSWPGAPASSSEFPASMQVDYVRAYASPSTIDVSGTAAIKTAGVTGQVLAGSAGISSVGVALLNAAGSVIAKTSTDANGNFSFANLAAGSYQIRYTPPAGQQLETGSQADPSTGLTAVFALVDGQTTALPVEALVAPTSTLSGTVVYAGAGQGGDTVSLLNADGTAVASTTTSSSGGYSFTGLNTGTYQLLFTSPSGEVPQFGGLADLLTGLTAPIQLASGQMVTLGPETLVALTPTLTGTVTSAGAGVGGVAVALLNASGQSLASTTTLSSGAFAFTGLTPGSYEIAYTPPAGSVLQTGGPANPAGITQPVSLASGQVLTLAAEPLLTNPATITGQVFLAGGATTAGDPGVTVALIDAAGDTIATASSDANGLVSFGDLAAGSYQLLYTPPASQDFDPGTTVSSSGGLTAPVTVAAGQTASAPAATMIAHLGLAGGVSSQVLLAGAGLVGVSVTLLGASGQTVATASTDAAGDYSFTGLVAGSYQLSFTAPPGDVLQTGGPANPTTGLTGTLTVTTGQVLSVAPEQVLTNPASIEGGVAHFGGATDPAWGGADAGATVTLLDTAGDVLATTVSDGNGWYVFRDIGAGTYKVAYTPPAGQAIKPGTYGTVQVTVGTPAGQVVWAATGDMISTGSGSGSAQPATITGQVLLAGASTPVGDPGVTVALIDATGHTVATASSDANGLVTFTNVTAGSYQLLYTPPAGQTIDPGTTVSASNGLTAAVTVAAGKTAAAPTATMIALPGITGQVLSAGAGQSGVAVTLLSTSGQTVATATTDAAGGYSFTGLSAGSYQLGFTTPSGYVLQTGGPANPATGLTGTLTVAAGQTLNLAPEQLLTNPASIEGGVAHFGGATDPVWGGPDAGATVTLLDPAGDVLATTVSDGNGWYVFRDIGAGTYNVAYAPPAGQVIKPGTSGTVQVTVGTAAGQVVWATFGDMISTGSGSSSAQPATVTGKVLLAGGATSVGDPGATVALIDPTGHTVATATSDANGLVTFTNVTAGSYQLLYTPPADQTIDPGTTVSATGGLTATFTVAAGKTAAAPTATMIALPNLSGQVVFGGDGQAGVTVTLLDASGQTVTTATTDSNGNFSFTGLAVGSYQVSYTAPPGELVQGTGGTTAATGLSATVSLALGQTVSLPPEVLVASLGALAGSVVAAGGGVSGATVTLYAVNGRTVATTTTSAAGGYSFSGVMAGSYVLGFNAPRGDVLQTGGLANPTTGLTGTLTVTAGQTLNVAPEQVLSNPANIQGGVAHFGGVTDPAWGGADAGATVTLLDTAGDVLATTVSDRNGWYVFRNIGAGTYQVAYTPPAGQVIKPGTYGTVSVTVGTPAGQTVWAAFGDMMSGFTMTGSGASVVQGDGSYIVTGTASNSSLTLGNGSQTVTLTGTADTVVTGNGNQTISLAGTGNSITVGTGTNIINAGSGGDTVHAAGGYTTISATGGGNLFDAGAGVGFLKADGSAGNVFMLNAPGSALMTTITGFNPSAQDVLDLHRTLAGTAILANLSNVGSFVTAATSGANTILSEATPGGTPQAFAVLTGVHTTVAQLLAGGNFSLT